VPLFSTNLIKFLITVCTSPCELSCNNFLLVCVCVCARVCACVCGRERTCVCERGSVIDWCCIYYFVRNSLAALLNALRAQICVAIRKSAKSGDLGRVAWSDFGSYCVLAACPFVFFRHALMYLWLRNFKMNISRCVCACVTARMLLAISDCSLFSLLSLHFWVNPPKTTALAANHRQAY